MAKKIRFPLKMKNGAEVRTLDELKENFDLESVLGYFTDGKLQTWLADRYYDEKAASVSELSTNMWAWELAEKLCEILEVEYQEEYNDINLEYIQRRNEKLRILSAFTDDKEILDNIDIVALRDFDLMDIQHMIENGTIDTDKIYLYGEGFAISADIKNVCYIGIGSEKPDVELITVDCDIKIEPYNSIIWLSIFRDKYNITFKNVRYDEHTHYYAVNFYDEGEYDRDFVFEVLYQSALDGDMYDQLRVGWMYETGNGISQDYAEAVKWYRKAAEQGNANAQCNLGYMYENGYGVTKDYAEAVKWYRKAAEQGYARGQCNLGLCYRYGRGIDQDYTQALYWYHKSAEQNYERAQAEIGIFYDYGYGVTKDYAEAAKWYRKAAEQGYAFAQCNLGCMYETGNGISQDYAEAVKWYRKAAEQRNANAQCNLGYMYEMGYGIEQDETKAVEWYRKSAAQGNETAKNNLNNLGVSL